MVLFREVRYELRNKDGIDVVGTRTRKVHVSVCVVSAFCREGLIPPRAFRIPRGIFCA